MTIEQDDHTDVPSTSRRLVFSGIDEARRAALDVVKTAHRSLAIYSHDLEPQLYDSIEFQESVKQLVLAHKYARVRILVRNPYRSIADGSRLIELARSMSSFIQIRRANPNYVRSNETFLIADRRGVMHRADVARWTGFADPGSPKLAAKYLWLFDDIWRHSEHDMEFRRLYV